MTDWRERLRKAIADSGLSLPEIALRADYDYVTLWKVVKKNKHTMKKNNMRKVCAVLKVDPDYIWNGYSKEGDQHYPSTKPLHYAIPFIQKNQLDKWLRGKLTQAMVDKVENIITSRPHSFAIRNHYVDIEEVIPMDVVVILDQNQEPRQGDFVMARYKDNYILRQLVISINEKYLKPTSSEYKTVVMGDQDEIVATVTGYYHILIEEPDTMITP